MVLPGEDAESVVEIKIQCSLIGHLDIDLKTPDAPESFGLPHRLAQQGVAGADSPPFRLHKHAGNQTIRSLGVGPQTDTGHRAQMFLHPPPHEGFVPALMPLQNLPAVVLRTPGPFDIRRSAKVMRTLPDRPLAEMLQRHGIHGTHQPEPDPRSFRCYKCRHTGISTRYRASRQLQNERLASPYLLRYLFRPRPSLMQPPNILFLLIDDLGWKDLSCYGSSFYETPNLDRLAAGGMRFTDAYASCPVCSPTRASLLSGKSPARVGVTQFIGGHAVGQLCDVPYFYGLPSSERSLASALREDAGYQTWHVGKWHLGEGARSPTGHGFEVNIGGCGWGMPNQGYFAPYGMPGLEDTPEGTYLTDALTDRASELIRQRDPDRPFFLNLWHYAVHTPIQAPADLVEKYQQKARGLGLDPQEALETGERFPMLHKREQHIVRRRFQSDPAYAAMVENLDTNIGRVLETLSEEGLLEDTLVIFTSDNGGLSTAEGSPTCNAPLLEGKGWMYEGGTRVCQIASWPGHIEPGSVSQTPVISNDLYPTLLDLAGLPPDPQQHADGVSLAGLLHGTSTPDRDALFWHYPHYSNQGETPACSIRVGDWKLIEHFEAGRDPELYHLREDIGETTNRAPEEPERTRDLLQRLRSWREEVHALIPEVNPNWPPPELPAGCDPPEL